MYIYIHIHIYMYTYIYIYIYIHTCATQVPALRARKPGGPFGMGYEDRSIYYYTL